MNYHDPRSHDTARARLNIHYDVILRLDHDRQEATPLRPVCGWVHSSGDGSQCYAELEPFVADRTVAALGGDDALRLCGYPFNRQTTYRITKGLTR